MKLRRLCFLLLLGMVLFLSACSLEGMLPQYKPDIDDAPSGDNNTSEDDTKKPSDEDTSEDKPTPEETTYEITFDLGGSKVKKTVKAGEIPIPPEVPDADYGTIVKRFSGWDKEVVAAMENTTYKALYESVEKTYTATFVLADSTITIETKAGMKPTAPQVPDHKGRKFALWDHEVDISNEDVTYRAIYTGIVGEQAMQIAWAESDWKYQKHGFRDMQSATSILSLTIEEHEYQEAGIVRDRIVEHLSSFLANDGAPQFDASCLWGYGIITAVIAVVRDTPTVWNVLPADLTMRINAMMKAFIYLESFATSDYNDYMTGPGMNGNYRKSWNPNYRLANVPVMVFATYYFGNGDIEKGAENVNYLIRSFDDNVYQEMIATFSRYGWRDAFKTWSTEGPVYTNSAGQEVQGPSARDLLVSGGVALGKDTYDPSKIVACGSGAGVSNGGKDYLYNRHSLYEPEAIMEDLLAFNYSGGAVKSDHWYDITGDGTPECVAWILDDTKSPYEGETGMMLEFASGNRSSTAYCDHDFTMVVALLGASSILPRYTESGGEREVLLDDDGNAVVLYDPSSSETLWKQIQIGNEDFIYKFIHGYQCYSTGSYGEAKDRGYESGASRGYWSMKSLWRNFFLPNGTVSPAN